MNPRALSLEEILIMQPECDNPVSTDLIAGQNFVIGTITAVRSANSVTVSYQIDDPLWSISEIHLAIGEIPVTRKNNPKVGHFGINEIYDNPIKSKTFTVDIDWNGLTLPVAAHAVVQKNLALDLFNETLSNELIDYSVSHPGTDSYFNTTVTSGGVSETFSGWCIDTDNTISSNVPYSAKLVSTYELAGMGLVENPENLDKVNWIINQDLLGQISSCGGEYTFGDIQLSIWTLIEDNLSFSGLGNWSQCRVDEIIATAYQAGNGFEPACSQEIAVALVPFDIDGNPIAKQITITQITIIEKLLECTEEFIQETAWGAGIQFNDSNWASKFYICNY